MTTRTVAAAARAAAPALIAAALTVAGIAWGLRLQAEVDALRARTRGGRGQVLPAPLSGRERVTICEELPVDPH